MSRGGRRRPVFALVVYAKRNVRDMTEKAFRSIAGQRRKPDKLIVVDDQSESGFEDVKERVIDLRLDDCHVQVLRNERTHGLSGAMNTALLKLMEYADERATYVAFMREEDELRHDHFSSLERAVRRRDADVILSDIRVAGNGRPLAMSRSPHPSRHLERLYGLDLDVASCLMAACCVRLEALLEGGLFNEALQGMQVHELLLRLSELPRARWQATAAPTLGSPRSGHRQEELTQAVVTSMRRGSRTFCLLARHRLGPGAESALHRAIRRRRDRLDPAASLVRWGLDYDLPSMEPRKLAVPHLSPARRRLLASRRMVVDIISRGNLEQGESGLPALLRDLEWLAGHLAGIHVEVLDNSEAGTETLPWFRALAGRRGRLVIRVARGGFPLRDATAAGFQASAPRARAEIQRRVARRARGGALAWFVDDDLSIVNRAMCWDDAEARRWFLGQLAALLEELGSSPGAEPAMVLGQVTDAPPVPGSMTYRLQLLDAVTAVRRLRRSRGADAYRYRDFHRILESWVSPTRQIRDFYYDVSSRDLVHLEFPFDYFPWDNGEFGRLKLTNREVLGRMVAEIPKLAKGKQVFRPIFADRHFAVSPDEVTPDGLPRRTLRPRISHAPSVLRGGNTVIASGAESGRYPTVTLEGLRDASGKPMTPRRADMVSALICRYLHGRQVSACSLPLRQRREDEGNLDKGNPQASSLLNPGKHIPDTEGFAIYSALKLMLDDRQLARLDTKLGKRARERCDFGPVDIARFSSALEDFRKVRTRALLASLYRVRGLARILGHELSQAAKVAGPGSGRRAIAAARAFADDIVRAIPRGFDLDRGTRLKILSSPSAIRHTTASKRRFLSALRRHRA